MRPARTRRPSALQDANRDAKKGAPICCIGTPSVNEARKLGEIELRLLPGLLCGAPCRGYCAAPLAGATRVQKSVNSMVSKKAVASTITPSFMRMYQV